jgi:hypothetical protein
MVVAAFKAAKVHAFAVRKACTFQKNKIKSK